MENNNNNNNDVKNKKFEQLYKKYKHKYILLQNNQLGGKSKNNTNNTNNHKSNFKPDYVMNVSEPWFTLIKLGIKSVEGRLNKGVFKNIKVNDVIEWKNNNLGDRNVLTKVISKNIYSSFKEYLEKETLEKCLPSFNSIDKGTDVYYKYYTKQDEQQYGVVAIHLEIIH